LLVRIVASEAGRSFELGKARIECGVVFVMGREQKYRSGVCGSLLNRSRIVSATRDLPMPVC
jgi:hypothetical protein